MKPEIKSDTVLRSEGMSVLLEKLGKVDTERFIALIIKEPPGNGKYIFILIDLLIDNRDDIIVLKQWHTPLENYSISCMALKLNIGMHYLSIIK